MTAHGESYYYLDKKLGLPAGYRLLGDLELSRALACKKHVFAAIRDVLAPDFDGCLVKRRVALAGAGGSAPETPARGQDPSTPSSTTLDERGAGAKSLPGAPVAAPPDNDPALVLLSLCAGSRASYSAQRCIHCGLTYGRRIL